MTEINQSIRWATVRQTSEQYKSFSESSLRYYIFHAKTNGLEKCLRRIGSKLLINLELFDQWIDDHKGGI